MSKKPSIDYRQDLDPLECHDCGDRHPVFMGAACHPHQGADVGYDKAEGCLILYCHVCKAMFARVAVEKATVQ